MPATPPEAPLFNPADLRSVQIELRFKNLVSGSEHSGEALSLDELLDHAVVLRLPPASCQADHHVLIQIFRTDLENSPLIFESTGKVSAFELIEDEQIRATVGLVQYDGTSWLGLLELFDRRQAEITLFLKEARD